MHYPPFYPSLLTVAFRPCRFTKRFTVRLLLRQPVSEVPVLCCQDVVSCNTTKEVLQSRNAACPSGLVAGAESRAVVSMKVFIEENEIAPVRIGLKLFRATVNRATPTLVPGEEA